LILARLAADRSYQVAQSLSSRNLLAPIHLDGRFRPASADPPLSSLRPSATVLHGVSFPRIAPLGLAVVNRASRTTANRLSCRRLSPEVRSASVA